MSRPYSSPVPVLIALLVIIVIIAALLTSCAQPVAKHVLFLRKDGTFAYAGNSFKERW